MYLLQSHRLITLIATLLICCGLSVQAQANNGGQYEQAGRFQVHYMAISSTFLTPKIAKTYHIKRSRYNAFVNVSILDTLIEGNPAVKGTITGKAVNLTGNTRPLDFKEVIEGDAVYYISELAFRNDEQFTIFINASNKDGLNSKISFKQTFYAD